MTTTRLRLTALGFSLLLGAGAIASCSSDTKSDDAGGTTTTAAQETTTTTAASATTASGTASCTEADMAKAAEPTHAGAAISDITCNSLNSRSAATLKDKGSCSAGCVAYFVADNGAWKLAGVQPAGDAIDANAYSDWNTLHVSWKIKYDVSKNPPAKTGGGSGAVSSSGSSGGEGDTSEAPVPTDPKSSFCTYYGPVPACVQDPMYMPPTIPPATEPPPESTPAP